MGLPFEVFQTAIPRVMKFLTLAYASTDIECTATLWLVQMVSESRQWVRHQSPDSCVPLIAQKPGTF